MKSKLYSMIEDSLKKKGLSVPSDSFIFSNSYKPEEEKLKAPVVSDDIYSNTNTNDGLNEEAITAKEYKKVFNDYCENKKQYLEKLKADAKEKLKGSKDEEPLTKEQQKFLRDMMGTSRAHVDYSSLDIYRDIEDAINHINTKQANSEEFINWLTNKKPENINEIFDDYLQNKLDLNIKYDNDPFINHFLPAYEKVLSSKVENAKRDYERAKTVIDSKKGIDPDSDMELKKAQEDAIRLINELRVLESDKAKFISWLENILNDKTTPKTLLNLEPDKVVEIYFKNKNDSLLKSLVSTLDTKSFKKLYPYETDVYKNDKSALKDENIIDVGSNKEAVKNALIKNDIPWEFMHGAFLYEPDKNHEKRWALITGVLKDENDSGVLEHVCIGLLKNEDGISQTDKRAHYKLDGHKSLIVPINKIKVQLANQTPTYLSGLKQNLQNKGEYFPLSEDQILHALLQGMNEYRNGERNDPHGLWRNNLIDIYYKAKQNQYNKTNEAATVISAALNEFSPGNLVKRIPNAKSLEYQLFVPYVNENNNIGIEANPEAKRFRQLANQK